ncbi:MAG: family 4 glycosyl hydrolase [Promethearchaeota archaeon]
MTSERFQLTYIGAGSHRFSLGLFRNILAAQTLHPMHVYLVDIDEPVLRWTHKVLEHMAEKAGVDVKVSSTTNQREALEGADFVYKSISVGGQDAEWYDIHVPFKFGIPQNTGDTVGPGGLFRGLRCAPVIKQIALDMKELCPDAVLLNYTNPQASIVYSARKAAPNVKIVGLCHELFGGMKAVRDFLNDHGKDVGSWEDLDIEYAGVNHFAWLTSCKLGGEDLYPLLREKRDEAFKKGYGRKFNWYLLGEYGWFPYPGSRHVAEFMPEYFNYFNHKSAFGITQLRDVESLAKGHKWALNRFNVLSRDFMRDYLPGPSAGGERAMKMTLDWLNDEPGHHVVNIPNKGYVPNLPEGAIVEVPGFFKDGDMHGLKMGPVDEAVAALLRPHCEVQRLTVEAAWSGDRDLVVKAALADPMCAFIEDPDAIEHMVDIMLHYEQRWLPNFKDAVLDRSELEKRKYWVAPGELATREAAAKVKYPPRDDLARKALP